MTVDKFDNKSTKMSAFGQIRSFYTAPSSGETQFLRFTICREILVQEWGHLLGAQSESMMRLNCVQHFSTKAGKLQHVSTCTLFPKCRNFLKTTSFC